MSLYLLRLITSLNQIIHIHNKLLEQDVDDVSNSFVIYVNRRHSLSSGRSLTWNPFGKMLSMLLLSKDRGEYYIYSFTNGS